MSPAARAGAARRLAGCRRGQVMVEFLIVFPPLFILFLCTLQLALLYAARLGARHAATAGARAAIVVFPDDPARYDDAPKYVIEAGKQCKENLASKLLGALGQLGLVDEAPAAKPGECEGGPRVDEIRKAVVLRMMPYAPRLEHVIDTDAIPGGIAGWLAGAALYNLGATAVTFPEAPGSATLLPPGHTYAEDAQVTVRVTHLAYCGIPIARFMMCDRFSSLATGLDLDASGRDAVDQLRAFRRVRDSADGMTELRRGVAQPLLTRLLVLSDARFRVVRAESTLPMMGAPYAYVSERTP